jgi:ribosome-associated translation inhibitor RaiA
MNRITVVAGNDSISAQARTYAEYRTFAVVARHPKWVRRVRVFIRQAEGRRGCDGVTCTVTVVLDPSGSLRIRATGSHVYAAINRAVERLGTALGRRVEERLSS